MFFFRNRQTEAPAPNRGPAVQTTIVDPSSQPEVLVGPEHIP